MSVAPKYDRIAFIYELIDLPLELLIFKKMEEKSTFTPERKKFGSRSGDWNKYEILSSMLFGNRSR